VLRDPDDVRDLKAGTFKLGANASVSALTAGAGKAATLGAEGQAVFVVKRGGLMVDISVTGQKLDFRPFLDKTAG